MVFVTILAGGSGLVGNGVEHAVSSAGHWLHLTGGVGPSMLFSARKSFDGKVCLLETLPRVYV